MGYQRDPNTIPSPLPTDYDRQHSFTDFQKLNPTDPIPGSQLDNEFNAVERALDETQSRLRLIQRDDGAVQNRSIGLDQLKNEAKVGVNAPDSWMPETGYAVNDSVIVNQGSWYLARESHTSALTFQEDLDAGKWRELINLTPYTTEAKNWANYPEDSPVPEGDGTEFSAIHHASKSLAAEVAAKLARDQAQTAQSASELARDQSQTAKSLSESAQSASELARDQSRTARDAAQLAETGAKDSETAAAQSESNAADSATSADQTLTEFTNTYYGPLPADPATRPDATASVIGDIYYNTAVQALKRYDGTEWLNFTDANAYTKVQSDTRFRVPASEFQKSEGDAVAWTAPTSTTLETATELFLKVAGESLVVAAGTPISLPALANGTDYFIWCDSQGNLQALDADDPEPAGQRNVGGFHVYAGTGGISPRSCWDLNWRPNANSPRGKNLSLDGKRWASIYMVDHEYAVRGYSKPGVQIADDDNRPIIPAIYGGDGTARYGSASWWSFNDVLSSVGERLPFYQEFTPAAYGVVERQAVGTDPGTTQHQAGHRSACGCEQITGVMWQWGADIAATGGSSWRDIAEGRGDVYASNITSPIFGAGWSSGASAGSRSSYWDHSPDVSFSYLGARGFSDHLNLQAER